jgi:Fe-S-cluster containining protein
MKMDMTPFFEKYKTLVDKVDSVFEIMKKKYPEEVRCAPGCTDCCYALFDLTLIEALYVNHRFQKNFSGARKEQLLEKANRVDRKTYKIKKAAYKAKQEGKGEEEIIEDVGKERIGCAMLNDENLCDIYDFRPIACRLDGIPVAVGGKGRTCPLSGFSSGQSYPTLNRDILHEQLLAISAELVAAIRTKYTRMGEILVPLSMALITDYDDTYFGLSDPDKPATGEEKREQNES